MPLTTEDKACLERNAAAVEAFKQFCQTKVSGNFTPEEVDYFGEEPFEEVNFYDLSLGFFIASGCSLVDCFDLARITRYNLQYWD